MGQSDIDEGGMIRSEGVPSMRRGGDALKNLGAVHMQTGCNSPEKKIQHPKNRTQNASYVFDCVFLFKIDSGKLKKLSGHQIN